MIPSRLEILTHAAEELAEVLDAARLAVNDPDYRGSQWFEVCRGNRLLPLYVMVDFQGNAFHVRRDATSFADESITVTYLPAWFRLVLDNVPARLFARHGRPGLMETVNTQVSDRDLAVPLRIGIEIRHATNTRISLTPPPPMLEPVAWEEDDVNLQPEKAIAAGIAAMANGRRTAYAVLPQISYDLRPSQGSALLGEDKVTVERVHWIAPSIRITASPGVSIEPEELYPWLDTDLQAINLSGGVETLASTPFWGAFVMNAAREQDDMVRARSSLGVTGQQALEVQVERLQNAEALPRPGSPRRNGGVSEVDLLAADWGAGERFEELTRPDGVDLLFLTMGASLALIRARSSIKAALLDAVNSYVYGASGRLPLDTPIPVNIRVNPQSAEDRFAYTVTRLPRSPGRTQLFRLAVIRTKGVQATANLFYGPPGAELIEEVLDYREEVVGFDKVPVAILDGGESLPSRLLPSRSLTPEEVADLTMLAIGMMPFPPCQVISDLNDYATILRYLVDGKDTLGRDMSRLDFALTCGGLLLPEVLEVVAKKAARLVTAGDEPGQRIVEAFSTAKPSDLGMTTTALVEGGGQ